MIPMDFVNKMRKEHQLIMGIGHRVKSVSTNYYSVYQTRYHKGLDSAWLSYSNRTVNHSSRLYALICTAENTLKACDNFSMC